MASHEDDVAFMAGLGAMDDDDVGDGAGAATATDADIDELLEESEEATGLQGVERLIRSLKVYPHLDNIFAQVEEKGVAFISFPVRTPYSMAETRRPNLICKDSPENVFSSLLCVRACPSVQLHCIARLLGRYRSCVGMRRHA